MGANTAEATRALRAWCATVVRALPYDVHRDDALACARAPTTIMRRSGGTTWHPPLVPCFWEPRGRVPRGRRAQIAVCEARMGTFG